MNKASQTFKNNLNSVYKLINFDKDVMDMAIKNVEQLHNRLIDAPWNIDNAQVNGERTLLSLQNIKRHDSLKSRYSTINSQAVVLLVSYFASAIADLFRSAAKIAVDIHNDPRVLNSELKIKVEDLIELKSSLGDSIGDVLISKNSISFQDMKSVQREFKKHFGIDIEKDIDVNNIILGQACRHTIAHEAGIVNTRVINQVKGATPRSVKQKLKEGETLNFTENEIGIIAKSMLAYVSSLELKVETYKNNKLSD